MEKRYNDVPIYSASVANKLLKLGYTIVNLSENKNKNEKGWTVFYFKRERNIQEDLDAITKK